MLRRINSACAFLILFAWGYSCSPVVYTYTLSTSIHFSPEYTLILRVNFVVAKKSDLNEIAYKSKQIEQALTMALSQVNPENIHVMNKLRVGYALEKICNQFVKAKVKRVTITQFALKKHG